MALSWEISSVQAFRRLTLPSQATDYIRTARISMLNPLLSVAKSIRLR